MQIYEKIIHKYGMYICIKIVNIQENNEKIFRALKSNVLSTKTKTAKYEQIVDRKSSNGYNVWVKLRKAMR